MADAKAGSKKSEPENSTDNPVNTAWKYVSQNDVFDMMEVKFY